MEIRPKWTLGRQEKSKLVIEYLGIEGSVLTVQSSQTILKLKKSRAITKIKSLEKVGIKKE